MSEEIRYFDCFAGIGGFHCGVQRIKSNRYKFSHAAYCEVEKNAQKVSEKTPPDEIEDHELGYVQELYKVYHEETGEEYARPADLDSQPKLKRDFNRQRKDYYSAETIRRELRDTIRQDETEGFDILKDEMYDGVITTRDKDYDSSFKRLTAVMEHATEVPISRNLQDRLLDWVGPGEKKGVCHILTVKETADQNMYQFKRVQKARRNIMTPISRFSLTRIDKRSRKERSADGKTYRIVTG